MLDLLINLSRCIIVDNDKKLAPFYQVYWIEDDKGPTIVAKDGALSIDQELCNTLHVTSIFIG